MTSLHGAGACLHLVLGGLAVGSRSGEAVQVKRVDVFPEGQRFLGVDGGGSRTRVRLWSGPEELFHGVGSASNPSVLGLETSLVVIGSLIEEALAQHPGPPLRAIGAGLAGVGPAEAGLRAGIEQGLVARFSCPAGVWNDAEAALAGATMGSAGVLLIGGTGSVALAFDGVDRVVQMGGWGRSLRDAGSAYELFQRFAELLLLAQEEGEASFEEGPQAELLSRLGLANARDLIPLFARGARPDEIEACGRILFGAAEHDDLLALELLEECGEDLLALALRCEKALALSGPLPLFLHGGLIERPGPVRAALERGLLAHDESRLETQQPLAGAEVGAVALQLDRLGETDLRSLRLAL